MASMHHPILLLLSLTLPILLLPSTSCTPSPPSSPSTSPPSPPPQTNLTTHLLTTFSAAYTATIASPSFFGAAKDGTVSPVRVAYFFGQDVRYGRGFLGLVGRAVVVVAGLRVCGNGTEGWGRDDGDGGLVEGGKVEELVLQVLDNWGGTVSGLADEAGRLERERGEILGEGEGMKGMGLGVCESVGTEEYVQFMLGMGEGGGVGGSGKGDGFEELVCAWAMGKAFIDVWTEIQKDQWFKPNKIPELQNMIDYWADPSYVAAVDATGNLVDQWFAMFYEDLGLAEEVFLGTLDKEAGFWKSVDAWDGSGGC